MKINDIFKLGTLVLLFLVIFPEIAIADQQNSSLVRELSRVDVFHPPANDSLIPLYNEWHYFNVIDEEQNFSAICVFKLDGSSNSSQVLLSYHTSDGNSSAFFGTYPIGVANYSSQTPNVTIAKNAVRLTEEGYSVHVESDNGSIGFDALFKPEATPSQLFSTSDFSPVSGEVINWIIVSPKMNVSGELFADGKTYTLENQRGYHDHNWGYWYWGDNIGWDWGQVSQTQNDLNEEYSLNFGNITDSNHTKSLNSVLNVWKDQKMVATFNDTKIEHSNFIYINEPVQVFNQDSVVPAGSFPLPLDTKIDVSSTSGDYLYIKFITQPERSTPLMVAVPIIDKCGNPMKDEDENIKLQYRIIWEMVGTYKVDGKIDDKNISYTTDGFMEYVSGNPVLPVLSNKSI